MSDKKYTDLNKEIFKNIIEIANDRDGEAVAAKTTPMWGRCEMSLIADYVERLIKSERELTSKYIDHVGCCEGVDFLGDFHVKGSGMTDEEVAKLRMIGEWEL